MACWRHFPGCSWCCIIVGLVYMLYLAWRIATAGGPVSGGTGGTAVHVPAGGGVPVGEPKVWIMGVTSITTFGQAGHLASDVALVALAFPLANAPALVSWTVFGTVMRRVLSSPYAVRVFNVGMAILLVLSLLPVLLGWVK